MNTGVEEMKFGGRKLVKRSNFIKNIAWLTSCLLLAVFLVLPATAHADQTRFFYDELGRLAGEDDGKGNVSVYNYDAVGNLLSVQRNTVAVSGIGVFLLAPSSGVVGTKVEIRGFGFSTTATGNQVAFNGKPATVLSSTAQSIFVTVPDGATTGPVTVTNANGTAASPKPFTVLDLSPVIRGIDPDRVAQGTTILGVISGVNLADTISLRFSHTGLSATILSGVTSQALPISLTVAPNTPVGSYSFSVTTPFGSAQSGVVAVTVMPLSQAFTTTQLSVFMPYPTTLAPSESAMVPTPGMSVYLRPPASLSPSGQAETAAPSTSVYLPPPTTALPSESSMSVAPPESVSMP